MWYLYILQCADDSLYIGATTDINRRLEEHNSKKGAKYTRGRTPVKLAYKEKCINKSEAQKRETQLKRWTAKKKQALINGNKSILRELSKSSD